MKLLYGRGINKAQENFDTHPLADKTIADVSEAIIGAALLSGQRDAVYDFDQAVKAVTAFVKKPDHDVLCWADYYKLYTLPTYQTAESSASILDLARQVFLIHPYKFNHPRLLRSAFIHPSQPYMVEKIPCYQRLEFLGDALLDMVSIDFLFRGHPDRDPQWLTEHKMAMVSNKFLAALSVSLGFHRHLRYTGSIIEKQNRDYATELEDARASAPKDARDYWTNTSQPPKALSDIVESYVGAIFVDSGFDYSTVQHFFDRHVKWYFEDMTPYDTFANNHPTTFLHKLLTLTFGCREYRLMADEIPAVVPGEPSTAVAALLVHGQVVADGEAASTKVAKVKASQAGLAIMRALEGGREAYVQKFGCDCVGKEQEWVGRDGEGVGVVGAAF